MEDGRYSSHPRPNTLAIIVRASSKVQKLTLMSSKASLISPIIARPIAFFLEGRLSPHTTIPSSSPVNFSTTNSFSDNTREVKPRFRLTENLFQVQNPHFSHNGVKISAFPEGQYFSPNNFHNSNKKSGKPSIMIKMP